MCEILFIQSADDVWLTNGFENHLKKFSVFSLRGSMAKLGNHRFRQSFYIPLLCYPKPSCAQTSKSSNVRAGRRTYNLLNSITLFYRQGNEGEISLKISHSWLVAESTVKLGSLAS